MLEKEHPIVALDHPQKPRKARPPRNNLMISLKIFPGEDREEIITYKRKKNKVKRQAVLEAFPAEEVHHELSEADRICSDCHHSLKEIGSWTVRKELVFIPAQIKRLDHIQHAYKCEQCSLNNEADKIIKAAIPKAPLWLKFNYFS